MSTVVLDIETVGCEAALAAPDAMAEMAARREQDPDAFAALCPALARPVAIGLRHLESGTERLLYDAALLPGLPVPDIAGAERCDGEAEMLARAADVLDKCKRIVSFNGRSFDLPILVHRAVAHGAAPSRLVLAGLNQKPWEHGIHIDLLLQMTFGGATGRYPLRAYAIGHGLEDPKAGGDGAHVHELVRAQETAQLLTYLHGDLETTTALYTRWQVVGAGQR